MGVTLALENLERNLELLATLPGPDRIVYLQGVALAMKLDKIGYRVRHVTVPAKREVHVELTNPKLEHTLIQKGLYKEVAYLESSGSIHITPSRIEGEIPHAPPIDVRFRESLFAAKCSHTVHVSPNAVHEHFSCARNKLDLILKLAEDAFKYGFREQFFATPGKKKFVVRYLDNVGVEHREEIEDDIAFYQRVRSEGLSVISIHKIKE